MNAKDTILFVGSAAAGSGIGFSVAGIVGGIVGGFAGLGILVCLYIVADFVNVALAEHYRKI